ncbi:MAG: glycolate oxidase subunit GlcE [Pseudomonadota bacterium]
MTASPEDADDTQALADAVRIAARRRSALRIVGSDSKGFLGRRPAHASPLSTTRHRGILSYQPEELVLTARAGTPLMELEALLAESGQHLPFDPPQFAAGGGTLGGAIASGLSGPARPYAGAARDFVLGVRMINGRGQILRFGGEVMKNVAGYDISRLVTGAYGTLGLLLDVSVKVLPAPPVTRSFSRSTTQRDAIDLCQRLRAISLPLCGAMWQGEKLVIRLGGSEDVVAAAANRLREVVGALEPARDSDWQALRDHTLEWFEQRDARQGLYRLSVAPASRPLDLPGSCLLDWGGAQRWLISDAPLQSVRNEARALDGHATRYHAPATAGDDDAGVFHPLPPTLFALHRRLKAAFDPHGVFNPGRLYPGI